MEGFCVVKTLRFGLTPETRAALQAAPISPPSSILEGGKSRYHYFLPVTPQQFYS
ncbi:MAG: hypothetical protein IKB21_02980 [Clostridia bacterium]|nr:hypothetical protein [Clostridia bacterium]MBR2221318.1 hypothetical protein [Clostridia bacterium]MBR2433550.1 hypothetical protein [Clostridia bacterium]